MTSIRNSSERESHINMISLIKKVKCKVQFSSAPLSTCGFNSRDYALPVDLNIIENLLLHIHSLKVILIICKYDNVSMKSEPDNLQLVSWVIIF